MQALKNGITADQILNFLLLHAHPQMLCNVSEGVCPPYHVNGHISMVKCMLPGLHLGEGEGRRLIPPHTHTHTQTLQKRALVSYTHALTGFFFPMNTWFYVPMLMDMCCTCEEPL